MLIFEWQDRLDELGLHFLGEVTRMSAPLTASPDVEVDVAPVEPEDLTLAKPGAERDHVDGPERIALGGTQERASLVRGEGVTVSPWSRDRVHGPCRVEGDEAILHRGQTLRPSARYDPERPTEDYTPRITCSRVA